MKVLTTITLLGSQKRLWVGSIRSPAACRGCSRGRPFLSEYPEDSSARYYKGGQSASVPTIPGDFVDRRWARRKSAFADPTTLQRSL